MIGPGDPDPELPRADEPVPEAGDEASSSPSAQPTPPKDDTKLRLIVSPIVIAILGLGLLVLLGGTAAAPFIYTLF